MWTKSLVRTAAVICAALAHGCAAKSLQHNGASGGAGMSGVVGTPGGQPGAATPANGGGGIDGKPGATTPGGPASVTGNGGAGASSVKPGSTTSDAGGTTGGSTMGDGGVATPGGGDCGANLLPVPDDMAQRGPWDVGVRTVKIGRLTVEAMYPAAPGSGANQPEATYDLRDWLPPEDKNLVPPDHSPAVGPIGGHFYRDVPIDDAHGPYPVVIFIHGTASMRIASGSTNVHWASRGFVVLAADYPGLGLADQLAAVCGRNQTGDQDIEGDVQAQISALSSGDGDVAFLKGHVDMTRLGISGHSQGACNAATLSTLPNVQIVLPLDGSTSVSPSASLKSIIYISGMDDTVIGYDSVALGNIVCPANPAPATSDMDGYDQSPGPPEVTKRIVGIKGGGHLTPTDLCQKNAQGRNAIDEAQVDGVCGIDNAVIIGLPALFDCGSIDWKDGVKAVNYASTAALEETLHCRDRSAAFANMQSAIALVGDFQHAP